jgi:hypothetical protein
MPYTSDSHEQRWSSDELSTRIPGWGVDLNPEVRPSNHRQQRDLGVTGAHWEFPERQEERTPRERSIEHQFLTPVFGTSSPPKGLSGVLRRLAYRRYSEARAAHWLILLAADRVDAAESHLRSFLTVRPDNPLSETGALSAFKESRRGSRSNSKRVDVRHMWIDPILIGAPWAVVGVLVTKGVTKLIRRKSN